MTSPPRRKARARIRYANNPEVRAAAKERSRKQMARFKTDPAYRERKNEWQRRWRAKRKANASRYFGSDPRASGSDRDTRSVSDGFGSLKDQP